jgi:hypothetical protein
MLVFGLGINVVSLLKKMENLLLKEQRVKKRLKELSFDWKLMH